MRMFTKEQADRIVEALGAKNGYEARKLRGQGAAGLADWLVWDNVSGHEVEVDPDTVAALCRKVKS